MELKKKQYTTPQLTVFGSVDRITQAIIFPGTGDVLSALLPPQGDDSGCFLDPGLLCREQPSTGS
jgi:hypothetical protein